ncbi:fructose-specific PTS transporter subunit EIIC [Streptomyces sp. NPDC048057]|uniref:PTS fructose transporter subunit IIABC n=1 Tax=Streptomyces sp. NPDC048057 TaxID=3155628 RepID=UPI0033D1AD8E
MSEMITADLVDLDLAATTREAAVRSLTERMAARGRITDVEGFLADVAAREARLPTGLEGGIGVPHARSAHVTEPTLAFGRRVTSFGRTGSGIDFGAPDGPADLIFLIAAPAGADDAHLTILSGLARRLVDGAFTDALRRVADPAAAAALLRGDAEGSTKGADGPSDTRHDFASDRVPTAVCTDSPDDASDDAASRPVDAPSFRIVAVTSCPTGIAHTYLAAEALQRAAEDRGVHLDVETQGSAGFTRLDPALIKAADGVVFAHDVPVRERARFAGKPAVDVGVKAGIDRPGQLIDEVRARAERGEVAEPTATAGAPVDAAGEPGDGYGTRLRTWLMSGVSYMVPFVAAGGLLIALAFAIGGHEINGAKSVAEHFAWTESASWAALLFQTGGLAFGFLVPVLAGYIAYGMADRPGLAPGFVGGAVALTIEAGFLGGLIAGLIAGGVVLAVRRVRVPAPLRGVMPVVVIPLVSSAAVGFLMFLVVGRPVAELQEALTDWLSGLSGEGAVTLGVVLGLMMCFDLGGPLNKVAYAFAVGGLAAPNEGSLKVMAAVMAAGMVPPLAMALATVVRARLFTRAERENGKAAWVLGSSFITEGAIPFAAGDPLRVIPAAMAGGAVTGGLSMAFDCTLRAPHGGVFVVPLIGNPWLYLVAIVAGTLVSTALVVLLKSLRTEPARGVPAEEALAPA